MKPSERRALREQKRAQQDAEARAVGDNSLHSDSSDQGSIEYYRHRARMERKEHVVKKEGFFSKHAMLITGVIGSLVVLGGVIFGIDYFVNYINENRYEVYDDGVDIEVYEVCILHDYYSDVEWRHFEKYNYTDYSGKNNIIKEYPIKGTDLVLRVGSSKDQKNPDYMRVIDYESGSSDYIDLLNDPRYFFEKRGYDIEEDD